jgi:hypothetical protein
MNKIPLLLLALMALTINTQAQTSKKNTSSKESSTRSSRKSSSKQNKQYPKLLTSVLTISAMSDIHNENEVDLVIQNPKVGLDLSYTKQVIGKVFSKGLSLGWQPIETTSDVNIQGETGVLKATNQMVHAHYTIRVSPLKNTWFQPYVEGIVGAKGAVLSSSFEYDDPQQEDVNDIQYFKYTWNFGYAGGLRFRATNLIYLDVRYARIRSGSLERVTDMVIDNNVITYETEEWEVPIGYLRAGISFSF